MSKKISDKLQEALWRAQSYLEEPEGRAEDWTPEQVEQYYKAKDSLDALAQAAQDKVWELIEKVLKEGFVGFHYGQNSFVFEPERDGMKRIKSPTAKEAILAAAKELEIE